MAEDHYSVPVVSRDNQELHEDADDIKENLEIGTCGCGALTMIMIYWSITPKSHYHSDYSKMGIEMLSPGPYWHIKTLDYWDGKVRQH